MKKLVIIVILIASAGVLWWASRISDAHAQVSNDIAATTVGSEPGVKGVSNAPATEVLPLAKRKLMPKEERLAWLEKNGEVPADGDHIDWQLASGTSWWGKPLDPQAFWKGRVLWLDNSARMDARRHGRQYPPMPYEDARFSSRANLDIVAGSAADGASIPFHVTDREFAFWGRFEMSHPTPPEDILREQLTIADRMLGTSSWNTDSKSKAEIRESIRTEPYSRFNYPQEAFAEDALFWSYVTDQRQKYQNLIEQGNAGDDPLVQNLLRHLRVSPNYLTDPLPEQAQAAGAWKITYLQRLQSENTDSSYINAYLQAWNLPASALSSGAKHP